jgi:hypothetical protein
VDLGPEDILALAERIARSAARRVWIIAGDVRTAIRDAHGSADERPPIMATPTCQPREGIPRGERVMRGFCRRPQNAATGLRSSGGCVMHHRHARTWLLALLVIAVLPAPGIAVTPAPALQAAVLSGPTATRRAPGPARGP